MQYISKEKNRVNNSQGAVKSGLDISIATEAFLLWISCPFQHSSNLTGMNSIGQWHPEQILK